MRRVLPLLRLLGLAVVVGIPAGLLGATIGPLTTFSNGTVAQAGEVNANFAAVKTAIEALPANHVTTSFVGTGRVEWARLVNGPSSCVIQNQSGFVASAARTGLGKCALTLNPVFATTPLCTFSLSKSPPDTELYFAHRDFTLDTPTLLNVHLQNAAKTYLDGVIVDVNCVGR